MENTEKSSKEKVQSQNILREDMTWLIFSGVKPTTQKKALEELVKIVTEKNLSPEECVGYFFPHVEKNDPIPAGYFYLGLDSSLSKKEIFDKSLFLRRLSVQSCEYNSMKTLYDKIIEKSKNTNFIVGNNVLFDPSSSFNTKFKETLNAKIINICNITNTVDLEVRLGFGTIEMKNISFSDIKPIE